MERLELEVQSREVLGKKVKALRRQGLTPANIYGHGLESLAIQVETKPLVHKLAQAGETGLIWVKVAGSRQPQMTLVRGVQRDPRTGNLLHVDFYQVKMTEKIRADVPLLFVGEAPAVRERGGLAIHVLDAVSVEALPEALPRSVEVDLSGLHELDQAIHVGDLALGDGVTVLNDPGDMVVKIETPRVEVEGVAAVAREEAAPAEAPAPEKASA